MGVSVAQEVALAIVRGKEWGFTNRGGLVSHSPDLEEIVFSKKEEGCMIGGGVFWW